jgi:hypothetical protein
MQETQAVDVGLLSMVRVTLTSEERKYIVAIQGQRGLPMIQMLDSKKSAHLLLSLRVVAGVQQAQVLMPLD